jgi:hypothetical protein
MNTIFQTLVAIVIYPVIVVLELPGNLIEGANDVAWNVYSVYKRIKTGEWPGSW